MNEFGKLAFALVVALSLVSLGHAQPPVAKSDPAGAITDVRLGELLDGMGLDPKQGTYDSGAHYFDVKVSSADYDFNIRVGLSPNKRVVWLMANLGNLPTDAAPERLRALLEAINAKTGKLQFRLSGSQLKADQPMDNAGVTASRLRKEIDDFATTLQDTQKIWDATKWEGKTEKVSK